MIGSGSLIAELKSMPDNDTGKHCLKFTTKLGFLALFRI